eukprot:m.43671 g.43671  ORF g.43671 m.43671 type:complete len:359 (+) comp14464_c0_seq1:187-1263(+)
MLRQALGLRRAGRALATFRAFSQSATQPPKAKRRIMRYVAGGAGAACAVDGVVKYNKFREFQKEMPAEGEIDVVGWKACLMFMIPTRALSRLWGWANEIELPTALRKPLLGLYARTFGCNLEEATDPDLSHYNNLQQLFRRSLVPGARPIARRGIVSPADSRVMHFGTADKDKIEQVKGVTYSVRALLGTDMTPRPGHKIFHMVFYLAPGDYHHFHAPVGLAVHRLRHIPGALLSVSPLMVRYVPSLFSINERVVLEGEWQHGQMCYVAVGAYNVGSILVDAVPELETNVYDSPAMPNVEREMRYKKGQEIGEFKLGSTIVLVFEAPEDFQFDVQPGQRVLMGQTVGSIASSVKSKSA